MLLCVNGEVCIAALRVAVELVFCQFFELKEAFLFLVNSLLDGLDLRLAPIEPFGVPAKRLVQCSMLDSEVATS